MSDTRNGTAPTAPINAAAKAAIYRLQRALKPTPAMSPADTAAHQAASHVRSR